jgi:hypothetical protein
MRQGAMELMGYLIRRAERYERQSKPPPTRSSVRNALDVGTSSDIQPGGAIKTRTRNED